MAGMDDAFAAWINQEMITWGWSQSELARRGAISNQMVSMVLTGQANPGMKFCQGVSCALGCSVVEVMQRAGRLPPTGTVLPAVADLNRRLLELDEAQRAHAVRAMEAVVKAIEGVARDRSAETRGAGPTQTQESFNPR